MKKIKFVLLSIMIFIISGCFNTNSMDNINITTSAYPIEYIVDILYGNHSSINSLYPVDSEVIDFKVTNVLLEQYKNTDLYIFNGLSEEKKYVKTIAKNNKNLKIIDVTSNMQYDYSLEELWLDPNSLLTIANNIKKGFEEYINNTYLINEINENYESLKINLTNLDGKFYSTVKKASHNTIITSDDAFKYLRKYGINVISIDPDTATQKDILDAETLLSNGTCNYIFIKYKQEDNSLSSFLERTQAQTIELYTMTNLVDINVDKNDYLVLMNQNLDNLKQELYK